VSIGAVGIHGQPWPEVSRPVRPQRGGIPELVEEIGPIGDQTTAVDEDTLVVDRRQLIEGGQLNDQVAQLPHRRAPGRDQASIRRAGESRYGPLDLAGAAHVDRIDLHTQ